MYKSTPVDWNKEAYLASGTMGVLRILYYTLMYFRFTYTITAWGPAFKTTNHLLESLISRAISLITDQSNTIRLQTSHKFTIFKVVYDYFVVCKIFMNICERKHERLTQKIIANLLKIITKQDQK